MHKVYIALGSNLGRRHDNIQKALQLLEQRIGHVLRVSSLIETEPVGFASDNRFINGACLVETELSPLECLHKTQEIEVTLGRNSKSVNGQFHDRTIDLDLLMYDNLTLNTSELTLPHPRMEEREFVMKPFIEIYY